MTVIAKRTATSALGVLATLGIAGSLPTGAAAKSSPLDDRPAAVARAQLDAVNRAPACWTTVSQPGGPQTTIYVTYRNCSSTGFERVTVSSSKVDGSGTFTYVNWCVDVRAGNYYTRAVTPADFPAQNTHRYTVTTCL